ncbi:MAG: hypothetical protein IJW51_04895 [Clostridia bacterium]|nr:hypothetical protein [Clostridia bacterium]MBQ9802387.1 hypothetical protein [Clostridia bacterium]
MTKSEVLAFVQSVKPHELEDAVMLRWLDELEKKIACEVHGRFSREEPYIGLAAEQLTVPTPYDKVYWTYLVSMIEFVQGTPESYQFANGVFEEAWRSYARFVQRKGGFGKRRFVR